MKRIKTSISKILLLASFVLVALGCKDKDSPIDIPEVKSAYFVAVEAATDPATDVLLSVESLETGEISPVNDGFQQPAWMSFFVADNKIIASGTTSGPESFSYKIANGKLEKGSSFITDLGIHAKTVDKDGKMLMMGSPRAGFTTKKIYVIDTETMSIINTKDVDFGNRESEGILSFPIDMKVSGDKLFVAYYEIKDDFSTPSANIAKIAIFQYPSLEFEKIIEDTRVPNLGRYNSINTLEEDEDGNIYTFASSSLACGFAPVPSTNSGILRIKKGADVFDSSYHIDFEELSGGYKINDLFYVANGKAVVRVLKEDETEMMYLWAAYSPTSEQPVLETGIIDLNAKTFKLLSNIPKSGGGFPSATLVEGNKLYIGVSSKNYSDIYIIDVEKGTSIKGAKIKGNYAKAILKLTE